jgi:hypothetical protein
MTNAVASSAGCGFLPKAVGNGMWVAREPDRGDIVRARGFFQEEMDQRFVGAADTGADAGLNEAPFRGRACRKVLEQPGVKSYRAGFGGKGARQQSIQGAVEVLIEQESHAAFSVAALCNSVSPSSWEGDRLVGTRSSPPPARPLAAAPTMDPAHNLLCNPSKPRHRLTSRRSSSTSWATSAASAPTWRTSAFTCGSPMLFDPPLEELSEEEIAAILRQAIQGAGRLPRSADVYLAGICAEHLVEGLRAAGVLVVRPTQQWRMHSEGPVLTRSHPED